MAKPGRQGFEPSTPIDMDKPRGVDAFLVPVRPTQPKKTGRVRLATATMHFRPDQLDWLQDEALRRGVSSAAIVREAIDAYMKEGQA